MTEPTGSRLPALGPRGEGWVAIQVVLIVALAVAAVLGPEWPGAVEAPFLGAALVVGLVGAVLFLGGMFHLGAQLTPYPKPAEGAALREGGLYALARHPIYGGGVLLALAWSLAASWVALLPTLLLALLFEAKSRREEHWLVEHHPGYEDYRRRVRRRFVPYLW
ncbi:MAG TPA: methyltransferase [Actinomycetota bacterium]|nr:methyltransferase [Actinomycetota bacterium]